MNVRDEGGWTPLHEAIGALKLENIRLLLEAGARLDVRSNEGTLSAEGERTVPHIFLYLVILRRVFGSCLFL